MTAGSVAFALSLCLLELMLLRGGAGLDFEEAGFARALDLPDMDEDDGEVDISSCDNDEVDEDTNEGEDESEDDSDRALMPRPIAPARSRDEQGCAAAQLR